MLHLRSLDKKKMVPQDLVLDSLCRICFWIILFNFVEYFNKLTVSFPKLMKNRQLLIVHKCCKYQQQPYLLHFSLSYQSKKDILASFHTLLLEAEYAKVSTLVRMLLIYRSMDEYDTHHPLLMSVRHTIPLKAPLLSSIP